MSTLLRDGLDKAYGLLNGWSFDVETWGQEKNQTDYLFTSTARDKSGERVIMRVSSEERLDEFIAMIWEARKIASSQRENSVFERK